jgi:arginine metabolism regulation protein II
LPNLGDPFHDSTYHLDTSKNDAALSIEPFQSWSEENIPLLNGPDNHEQPPAQTLDDNRQAQEKASSSIADQSLSLQSLPSMPPVPKASYLSDVERFLMYHYIHRVVNLFCVIDNQKSPWKLIHLPKALQSVGDLNISGSSSRIRDALRNALLSISAFCLSNDGTFRQCEDDAAKWAQNASRYRAKSIKLLKDAVEKDLHPASPTGYKEFLATMLSMVSINVSIPVL